MKALRGGLLAAINRRLKSGFQTPRSAFDLHWRRSAKSWQILQILAGKSRQILGNIFKSLAHEHLDNSKRSSARIDLIRVVAPPFFYI